MDSGDLGSGITVIRPTGRLNMVSAPRLRLAVHEAVIVGRARVVVDLGEVEFIDSSGLGTLVGCLKDARAAGGDLRILHPGAQAAMMLRLSMLDQVLVTAESAETAYDA